MRSLDDATVSGTGSLAAAVGADGVGRLWQLPSGRVLLQIHGARPGRRSAFSADGRQLLIAGGNAVHLVDTATRREVAVRTLPGRVVDARFSADGTHVVAATSNGYVRIWTVAGELVRGFKAGPSALVSVALSPDSSRVAAAARDGGVKIWSVRTGRLSTR
jgi:FOG: WD40 repeat